jgi:hypothetical protein
MDAYRNIDGIIERKVRDTGSTLFSEWAGEPSRFFHLPGDPPWECFQVVIFPPEQGAVVVQAASIDTNDGAEMLEVWQGSEGGRYQGGTTAGSKWGCGVAAFVTAPLFFIFMIADALGDCAPDAECKKGFVQFVLLPSVVIALGLFFAIRFIVNRLERSDLDS